MALFSSQSSPHFLHIVVPVVLVFLVVLVVFVVLVVSVVLVVLVFLAVFVSALIPAPAFLMLVLFDVVEGVVLFL